MRGGVRCAIHGHIRYDRRNGGTRLVHSHTLDNSFYTSLLCAAGVETGTADRDSSRYRYSENRKTRQLTLDCECNWVKSTHDVYGNTWKCGELKLYFSPSAGGYIYYIYIKKCDHNWFGVLSNNWNWGRNWFGVLSINWNLGHHWFGLLSINWNGGHNRFEVLFINWYCGYNWFGLLSIIGIAATTDLGAVN